MIIYFLIRILSEIRKLSSAIKSVVKEQGKLRRLMLINKEEMMGELIDKFNEVKQAIADERAEVLAAIQALIDAGNSGEKITVAMLQELKSDVQGVYVSDVPPTV